MRSRATELMVALKIPAGSDQPISPSYAGVLWSNRFSRVTDFSVRYGHRAEQGDAILQEIELVDTAGNIRFCGTLISGKTPKAARAALFEGLVMNSMPMEMLKESYRSITNGIGEVCLRRLRFEKSANMLVEDGSEMAFVRGDLAVRLYSVGRIADVAPLARAIDNFVLESPKQ